MMHIEAGAFIQRLGVLQHVPTTGFVHMQANGLVANRTLRSEPM
jgi:hypothetical protein